MKILFICTGNYYRSRFAELYFNHLAPDLKLESCAYSKGLNPCTFTNPISDTVLKFLETLDIRSPSYRMPAKLLNEDFKIHDLFIALDEQEHRPMVEKLFPYYADQIEYWHVADKPELSSKIALPKIAKSVEDLLYKLSTR